MPVFNDLQRLFQQSYEGLPDFSVSIGYAKYDESLNYIPKFIEKADHYMYPVSYTHLDVYKRQSFIRG